MFNARRVAVLAALPLLALLAAGCSSSSSGGSTTTTTSAGETTTTVPAATATAPPDPAAAEAEIRTTWTTFFDYRTPVAKELTLLEGGAALTPAIHTAQREQKATHLKEEVKVKSVEFMSPTQATVHYSLLNGTHVLLANSAGVAILDGGSWKVSKLTFCSLVELGNNGKPVPSC